MFRHHKPIRFVTPGSLTDWRHQARSIGRIFQAEDGIRDVAVTGVQTCALPISAKQAMPNQPENIGQVFNSTATAAKTATSASRKSDLPTCMGGDRNDWHNHFLAAVRKTMNRRIRDMRVQHRQRYSRFAGVLSTMVMLIGFSLLTTTVA